MYSLCISYKFLDFLIGTPTLHLLPKSFIPTFSPLITFYNLSIRPRCGPLMDLQYNFSLTRNNIYSSVTS